MKTPQKQSEYKSDSLSLSAYLVCNSHQIKRVEPSPNIYGKYYFVFDESPTLTDLVNKFNTFTATTLPQPYYIAIRDVKRMLNEYRNMK